MSLWHRFMHFLGINSAYRSLFKENGHWYHGDMCNDCGQIDNARRDFMADILLNKDNNNE